MRSPVRIRPSAPLKSCKTCRISLCFGENLQDWMVTSCILRTSSVQTVPKINAKINFEGRSGVENAHGARVFGLLVYQFIHQFHTPLRWERPCPDWSHGLWHNILTSWPPWCALPPPAHSWCLSYHADRHHVAFGRKGPNHWRQVLWGNAAKAVW